MGGGRHQGLLPSKMKMAPWSEFIVTNIPDIFRYCTIFCRTLLNIFNIIL